MWKTLKREKSVINTYLGKESLAAIETKVTSYFGQRLPTRNEINISYDGGCDLMRRGEYFIKHHFNSSELRLQHLKCSPSIALAFLVLLSVTVG